VKFLLKNKYNEFIDFMETCELYYHYDFVAQCVLNKFWDGPVIILKSRITTAKSYTDFLKINYDTDDIFFGKHMIECNILNNKIKIHDKIRWFCREPYIINVINDYKCFNYPKQTQIIRFIKKMNVSPITVYKRLSQVDEELLCLKEMQKYYDIQIKIKPIKSYMIMTSWKNHKISQIIVCHTQQNKFVFNNEVKDIVDNNICSSGYFTSPISDYEVKYKFNMLINKYTCVCNCRLNEIGYIKHFHGPINIDSPERNSYGNMTIIEYEDIFELSEYKKFFNNE